MKRSLVFSALTLALGLASGCYYPNSQGQPRTSAFNSTTVLAGTAGAAGGGFVGNTINKQYGAPVGAAAGALLAGGGTYVFQERKQREAAEAYAEGERAGRAQALDEWWSEHAILNDPQDQNGRKGPKTRQIPLPGGIYESVPYHARTYEYMVRP